MFRIAILYDQGCYGSDPSVGLVWYCITDKFAQWALRVVYVAFDKRIDKLYIRFEHHPDDYGFC